MRSKKSDVLAFVLGTLYMQKKKSIIPTVLPRICILCGSLMLSHFVGFLMITLAIDTRHVFHTLARLGPV